MLLRDVVLSDDYNFNNITIEYRTVLPERFKCGSILTGLCKYENGFITSLDGDDYSLDDVINGFKYDENQDTLIVYIGTDWK